MKPKPVTNCLGPHKLVAGEGAPFPGKIIMKD